MGVCDRQSDAFGFGHGHGFSHSRNSASFHFGQLVKLAIGQARDAAQRAGGHIHQQLVPHRAHDVFADIGQQACLVENLGNARHTGCHFAIEFADVGVFSLCATDDVPCTYQHTARIGFARQHTLLSHRLSQDVFVAQTVLQ